MQFDFLQIATMETIDIDVIFKLVCLLRPCKHGRPLKWLRRGMEIPHVEDSPLLDCSLPIIFTMVVQLPCNYV